MFREGIKTYLRNGDITYFITACIMVVLPVHYKYLPPLMILLGLSWIFENYSGFGEMFRTRSVCRNLFIAFLVFYLWQITSLLYTDDLRMGLLNVFGRLSLLVFPLLLFHPAEKISLNVLRLLRIFSLSTAIFTVSCFVYALYRSLSFQGGSWIFNPHPAEFDWQNYFYGPDLTYSIHPSYLAMFVLLSVFISFESWYDHSLKVKFRFGWLLLGVLLSFSIYFISSRAGILAGILMISFYAVNKMIKHKKSRILWILVVVILIFSLPLIRKNERVNNLLKGFSEEEGINLRNQDERLIIWRSAIDLIRQNPILGVGIGDVRAELTGEYIRAGEEKLSRERLNAHNQFLEVFIEGGVIGFIMFITILGFMIFIAVNERNLLYGLFILMIFVFFMFETVLYRLAGVAFFSLFSFIIPQMSRYRTYTANPK
jgi:O-antigen ligase